MPWIALSRASNLREGYACRHSVPTNRTSRLFPSKVNLNSIYYLPMSLMYPVSSHLLRLSYALMYILRLAMRPRFFARLYVRLICIRIYIYVYIRVRVIPRHARTRTYTERKKRVCVYTRTTRREIRIIGSNDGSRGTGAGKSQRLSLLVAIPFFFFSFLFLLFVATSTQRSKNSEGYTGRLGILVFVGLERALRSFVHPIAPFTALSRRSSG